jgi:hypothetical protein
MIVLLAYLDLQRMGLNTYAYTIDGLYTICTSEENGEHGYAVEQCRQNALVLPVGLA